MFSPQRIDSVSTAFLCHHKVYEISTYLVISCIETAKSILTVVLDAQKPLVCAGHRGISARILGGHNISIIEAPYHVNYGDICGAVLIHQQWALTAAHCGTDSSYIRVGNKHRLNGARIKILTHLVNPGYAKHHVFDYDVQLLRFRKLHFSAKVSAIEINGDDHADSIIVAGWGYDMEKGDYKEFLQEIKLNIVPLEECQRVDKFWYNHTLTTRMFCAGGPGKDACQGDSGGGAVSEGRLLGISSFGFGCGRNIPGVYINITENSIRSSRSPRELHGHAPVALRSGWGAVQWALGRVFSPHAWAFLRASAGSPQYPARPLPCSPG
ncbi:hypothetical protein evm_007021 [Chilo suppressalis]|nr:hypothetical protein evm_007021 [Chilo suppressalis]